MLPSLRSSGPDAFPTLDYVSRRPPRGYAVSYACAVTSWRKDPVCGLGECGSAHREGCREYQWAGGSSGLALATSPNAQRPGPFTYGRGLTPLWRVVARLRRQNQPCHFGSGSAVLSAVFLRAAFSSARAGAPRRASSLWLTGAGRRRRRVPLVVCVLPEPVRSCGLRTPHQVTSAAEHRAVTRSAAPRLYARESEAPWKIRSF